MFKRKTKSVKPNMPSTKIALILDETILDVLHVDERLGAILLSEPIIHDVTELFKNDPEAASRLINAKYDDKLNRIIPTPDKRG